MTERMRIAIPLSLRVSPTMVGCLTSNRSTTTETRTRS